MHPVVIDQPYEFVPPYEGRCWPWLLQRFVGRYLRRQYGVERIDCEGLGKINDALAAGDSVLLAPNHCRPADPLVVTEACRRAGVMPLTMASWHLFMQSRLQRFILRRIGAFSVYREGLDRRALQAAVEILQQGRKPLVVFPEGVITRANDRLLALMEGVSFIARSAAKKRKTASAAGNVVVIPIGIRYRYHGDVHTAVSKTLDSIEARLSWRPRHSSDLVERIYRVGEALLWLKEIEYFGHPQQGEIPHRLQRLIDRVLVPLEEQYRDGKSESTTVARVKQLRIAVMPRLLEAAPHGEERQRMWIDLADMYMAQQMSHYPPDYVRSNPTPERLLETAERLEEDLTDTCRVHRPFSATVRVGDPIKVSPQRIRGAKADPVMTELEDQLRMLLDIQSPSAAEEDLPRQQPAADHLETSRVTDAEGISDATDD